MNELEQLKQEIGFLQKRLSLLENSSTIPYDIEQAFRERLEIRLISDIPANLTNAPLALVTAPSGGATIDSQARTAINALITRLEDLGLILPN